MLRLPSNDMKVTLLALTFTLSLDLLFVREMLSAITVNTACDWNGVTSLSCPGQGARLIDIESVIIYSSCTEECMVIQANTSVPLDYNALCNPTILYLIRECHGMSDCLLQSAIINRYINAIDSSTDYQSCVTTAASYSDTAIKTRITYNCKRDVNYAVSNNCHDNITTSTEQITSYLTTNQTVRLTTSQSASGSTSSRSHSSVSTTSASSVPQTYSNQTSTSNNNNSVSTVSMYSTENPDNYFWPTTTIQSASTWESSAPDITKPPNGYSTESDATTKAVIIVTCTLASVLMIAGFIMLAVFLNHRKQRLRRQQQLELERKCEPMRDYALIVDFRQESGVGAVNSPDYDYAVTRENCSVCRDRGHKYCIGHKRHSLQKMDFNFLRPDGYYERMGNRDDRHVYSELGMTPATCSGPGRIGKIPTIQIDSVQGKPLPEPVAHYAYLKDSISGDASYQKDHDRNDHIYEELPAHRS